MKYVEDLRTGDTFADLTVLEPPEHRPDGSVRVVARRPDGERTELDYEVGTTVQVVPQAREAEVADPGP